MEMLIYMVVFSFVISKIDEIVSRFCDSSVTNRIKVVHKKHTCKSGLKNTPHCYDRTGPLASARSLYFNLTLRSDLGQCVTDWSRINTMFLSNVAALYQDSPGV